MTFHLPKNVDKFVELDTVHCKPSYLRPKTVNYMYSIPIELSIASEGTDLYCLCVRLDSPVGLRSL